jgi:hypothetical protein
MSGMAQPFCRQINDYAALVRAVADRSEQMQVSRAELDHLAGLPDGFAGKCLSAKPVKNMGPKTLGPVLGALGLILILVEDPAARDKTLARRVPFNASNRRVGNQNRLKSLAAPSAPPVAIECVASDEAPRPRSELVMRSHLRVVQPRHKGARFGGML